LKIDKFRPVKLRHRWSPWSPAGGGRAGGGRRRRRGRPLAHRQKRGPADRPGHRVGEVKIFFFSEFSDEEFFYIKVISIKYITMSLKFFVLDLFFK
jgi:hypothetical protein